MRGFSICLYLMSIGCNVLANSDTESVTISGISAGAFMASQFHVAFSSRVHGVGMLAGGPYYCAMDDVALAEERCMKTPNNINVEELVSITHATYLTETIDNPTNMATDKIWIFSARNDTVVQTGVVEAVGQYYDNFIENSSQIEAIYNIDGEHSFITVDQGSECLYDGEPYINACNFDAAGSILNHLLSDGSGLIQPTGQNNGLDLGSLITFNQLSYLEVGYTSETSSLYKEGYIYVPDQCLNSTSSCQVHVSFHGCQQTIDDIGQQYLLETGYNRWAAANNLIILYPQIVKSTLNPNGCFDWWGYTGTDYASKLGVQMYAVNGMINSIHSIISESQQ